MSKRRENDTDNRAEPSVSMHPASSVMITSNNNLSHNLIYFGHS